MCIRDRYSDLQAQLLGERQATQGARLACAAAEDARDALKAQLQWAAGAAAAAKEEVDTAKASAAAQVARAKDEARDTADGARADARKSAEQ
eukprot:6726552-Prymnesium_polylepis.1